MSAAYDPAITRCLRATAWLILRDPYASDRLWQIALGVIARCDRAEMGDRQAAEELLLFLRGPSKAAAR